MDARMIVGSILIGMIVIVGTLLYISSQERHERQMARCATMDVGWRAMCEELNK